MICIKKPCSLTKPLPTIALGRGLYALVDAADLEQLSHYHWFAKRSHSNYYAVRRVRRFGKDRLIRMHRQITHCPPGLQVHHLNRNSLDNRRSNLLICEPWVHQRIQQSAGPHHAELTAPPLQRSCAGGTLLSNVSSSGTPPSPTPTPPSGRSTQPVTTTPTAKANISASHPGPRFST